MSEAPVRECAAAAIAVFSAGWGCTSEPATTSTTSKIKTDNVTGTVSTLAQRSLERSFDASRAALEELQFKLGKAEKDALMGVLSAKTAEGTTVDVNLSKVSDEITDVSVNAGPLGTSLAQTVMAKIADRLK